MTAVSAAVGGEVVDDRGTESESSAPASSNTSLPSLPHDSSETGGDDDGDSLRKNSANLTPSSKDAEGVHRLETPQSSVHRAPVTSSMD
jgi:hypothetical protein